MPRRKKHHGVGAICSVLTSRLHPSAVLRGKYPHGPPDGKSHRTINLYLVRQQEIVVTRKKQLCYVIRSDDFKRDDNTFIELHAVRSNVRVEREGAAEYFFEPVTQEEAIEENAFKESEAAGAEVPEVVQNYHDDDNVAVLIRNDIDIDDDNEPAPENEPTINDTMNECIYDEWGFTGLCNRRKERVENNKPKLKHLGRDVSIGLEQLFERLFPNEFLKDVIIKQSNKNLHNPMDYGEFLRFLGLWFVMATTEGCERRDFWSGKVVDMFEGAPYRFNNLMERTRFDDILAALRFTNIESTTTDRFHEIRQLQKEWNENMANNYEPSWINCLDESMSMWTNRYTCPGYMYVPRKPWPFGNEYHTLCDGLSQVMYSVEIVEGRDAPTTRNVEFSELGKTVGLLLRLTKPIWHKGNVLVLDSGFCVLKGITALKEKGVFAAATIKKRRYWPKFVKGDEIAEHFRTKEVGEVDVLPGKLDGVPFSIHCMKEPDYVMSIMTSYGTTEEIAEGTTQRDYKDDNGEPVRKKFKYTEIIYNHFKYRHAVDDHNNKRHQPISFEEIWATKWWPNRVFAFFLAITEVNIKLVMENILGSKVTSMLQFRRRFAKVLIHNSYIVSKKQSSPRRSPRNRSSEHRLETVDPFTRWDGYKWSPALSQYPQRKCNECKRKVRTYCICNPSVALCTECYGDHLLKVQYDRHGED